MKSDLVDIICVIMRETKLAVLIDDGDNEVWLPKEYAEIDRGLPSTVTIPEWLAIKKGLI